VDVHKQELEIGELYARIREALEKRFASFKMVWEHGSDEEVLCELLFCLLTPAARAHAAWQALSSLREKGLILGGKQGCLDWEDRSQLVARELHIVRFKNNKARNILEAEQRFTGPGNQSIRTELLRFRSHFEKREWLVHTVRGMGYKEASHFLRNIGLFEDIAILDRHVLRNLTRFEVVERMPEGLSRSRYLLLEEKMRVLAERMRVPLHHLDMVFWYRETGEMFK